MESRNAATGIRRLPCLSGPIVGRRTAPALSNLGGSFAVLASTLLVMTRNTEGLQVQENVSTAVDQGNPVVEFPERATRHESLGSHARPHAAPLEGAAQRVGVHATDRAHPAVTPAYAPPQLTRIRRVVDRHTGGMPAAVAIERTGFRARVVQDRLAAPAAGPARSVGKRDRGASVVQSRFAPSMRARKARLRVNTSLIGFSADPRVVARFRGGL